MALAIYHTGMNRLHTSVQREPDDKAGHTLHEIKKAYDSERRSERTAAVPAMKSIVGLSGTVAYQFSCS